jgi:hypothetical protein
MPFSQRQVERALISKLKCVSREGHHTYFDFYVDNVLIASTYMSHGKGKEIGDFLSKQMAKQLLVTRSFFEELVRCTKSLEEYLETLRQNGHLSR